MTNFESEYVSERLNSNRDDRCDEDKWSKDAVLRGRIGTTAANRIIDMIDEHKSWR